MDIRRAEGRIAVENDRLALVVELDRLQIDLASQDSETRVRFASRASIDGAIRLAERVRHDGHGEIRTRLGTATRIQVRCDAGAGIELWLSIDVGEDWPGIAVELAVRNGGDRSVVLDALDPLWMHTGVGGVLALPGAPDQARFFRLGYQSDSPSGYASLAERSKPKKLAPALAGPRTPPAARDVYVSDFATALGAPASPGVSLGFLTHERFLSWIIARGGPGGFRELVARADPEQRMLLPRERVASERLWVGLYGDEENGVAHWAERAGAEMLAPVPAQCAPGWSSRYAFGEDPTAAGIARNARRLTELETGAGAVQVDCGYCPRFGDWLDEGDGFPGGLAPLAASIRDASLSPGLWLAPFLAASDSRLAREHPDWLLCDARQRPLKVAVGFGGQADANVIDVTHAEALDWMAETVQTLGGYGFESLELDFLFAGTLAGARHQKLPTAVGYRAALARLRSASTPAPFLIGGAAPLGPSIGLLDSVRVSPDLVPRARASFTRRLFGGSGGSVASPIAALRNNLARAPLHQKLWLNDPGPVLLRELRGRPGDPERSTQIGVCSIGSGRLFVSDDLEALEPSQRELLRRILPGDDASSEPLATGSGAVPERMLSRASDGSLILIHANLGARPCDLEIALDELGFEPDAHVFDVWAKCALEVRDGAARVEGLEPGASILVRISPADERPRVVNSTLSLQAGVLETAAVRKGPDGSLLTRIELPGERRGTVWIAQGKGPVTAVEICFRDSVEVETHALGLEDLARMADS